MTQPVLSLYRGNCTQYAAINFSLEKFMKRSGAAQNKKQGSWEVRKLEGWDVRRLEGWEVGKFFVGKIYETQRRCSINFIYTQDRRKFSL
jgi:hypothetical protein